MTPKPSDKEKVAERLIITPGSVIVTKRPKPPRKPVETR
jgi:hypothetical protein